jgi:thioredoxin 1
MKKGIVLLFVTVVFLSSCGIDKKGGASESSNESVLSTISVDEFEKKICNADVQLIDVRTAEEFSGGYLKGAANIDVNSNDFDTKLATYDKSKPVLVYCLSGGRSSAAADKLSEMGFKQVFNMEGGIMKWEAANKPLESIAQIKAETGMDKGAFLIVVSANKQVLVDFNAKWCAPCKKMLPMLEALAENNKDKFTLLQIDADENKALLKELAIEGIPYFQVYENGKLTWSNAGLTEEAEIKKALGLK